MENKISNQFRTLFFTQKTLLTFGQSANLQKASGQIAQTASKHNLKMASNRYDLTSTWKNGWYVTQGDDPRKNTSYQSANCDNSTDINNTLLKIGLSDKKTEVANTPTGFRYSGVMKYSPEQYGDGIFAVVVNVQPKENAKFAFWLKNFQTDVNEIDVVEIFNFKVKNWFGKKLMKAIFTLHGGTNYSTDHTQNANSACVAEGYHVFELERMNGKLTWRVDGFTVKTEDDPNPSVKYGLILDYEAWGEIAGYTAVISRMKEMYVYSKITTV